LARTVYIRIYTPYIWWFPSQKYRIYTVDIWFWPTLNISHQSSRFWTNTHAAILFIAAALCIVSEPTLMLRSYRLQQRHVSFPNKHSCCALIHCSSVMHRFQTNTHAAILSIAAALCIVSEQTLMLQSYSLQQYYASFLNKHSCCNLIHCSVMHRVGQNRIYTPYMTVYLVVSLPKIPYLHRIYMVLANLSYASFPNKHSCCNLIHCSSVV